MAKSPWRSVLAGSFGSIAMALLWTWIAALNPTTNYHLAPLIAILAAPTVGRMTQRQPARQAAITVAIGVVVTVIAAATINVAGWAHGPTFTSSVTPLAELLGAIAIGAVLGTIIAFAPGRAHHEDEDTPKSEATIRSSSSTDH